jgi:hypothetical protein
MFPVMAGQMLTTRRYPAAQVWPLSMKVYVMQTELSKNTKEIP